MRFQNLFRKNKRLLSKILNTAAKIFFPQILLLKTRVEPSTRLPQKYLSIRKLYANR